MGLLHLGSGKTEKAILRALGTTSPTLHQFDKTHMAQIRKEIYSNLLTTSIATKYLITHLIATIAHSHTQNHYYTRKKKKNLYLILKHIYQNNNYTSNA